MIIGDFHIDNALYKKLLNCNKESQQKVLTHGLISGDLHQSLPPLSPSISCVSPSCETEEMEMDEKKRKRRKSLSPATSPPVSPIRRCGSIVDDGKGNGKTPLKLMRTISFPSVPMVERDNILDHYPKSHNTKLPRVPRLPKLLLGDS